MKNKATITIDGLIEGRLPERPAAEQLLHEWTAQAAEAGMPCILEIQGAQFNILPKNTPLPAQALRGEPARVIGEQMRGLLAHFSPAEAQRLFSTIRTLEEETGRAIQTLYVIGSDGALDIRQRSLAPTPSPARAPMARRERFLLAFAALVALLLLAVGGSYFFDYPTLYSYAQDQVSVVRPSPLKIGNDAFSDYFVVSGQAISRSGERLLTLRRTELFPRTEPDRIAALRQAEPGSERYFVLQSLALGYVRCECYDGSSNFIASVMLRIKPLRESDSPTITIPLPLDRPMRVRSIVLTY